MPAFINQNFTIHGTLSVTLGVSGANITLRHSTDNATWKNVTTTATHATGGYQFSNNEAEASIYYNPCDNKVATPIIKPMSR